MIRHPHPRSPLLSILACNGGTWSWACDRLDCDASGGGWFRRDYAEAAGLKHERGAHHAS